MPSSGAHEVMHNHAADTDGPAPAGAPASTRTRNRTKSRGQAFVEFAVVTPVLLIIFATAVDFGRALTAYIAVSAVAREGAIYGSQSVDIAEDSDAIRAHALLDAPTIWGTAPTVTPDSGEDAYGYTYVEVTVEYTYVPLLSILPFEDGVEMNRVVRMRVIN